MFGLTTLGTFHTAVSLVAVAAGIIAFFRHGGISLRTQAGVVYFWTTVVTCVTGFGIFQHGGFGKPHILGIITLVVLAIAAVAGKGRLFGRAAPYVETVAYTMTFLFHMIPAITETSTRLPLGAPLLPNADAPQLQSATAVLFVLFAIGAAYQVVKLRRQRRPSIGSPFVRPT
jgi:uncharacterized membrane protein